MERLSPGRRRLGPNRRRRTSRRTRTVFRPIKRQSTPTKGVRHIGFVRSLARSLFGPWLTDMRAPNGDGGKGIPEFGRRSHAAGTHLRWCRSAGGRSEIRYSWKRIRSPRFSPGTPRRSRVVSSPRQRGAGEIRPWSPAPARRSAGTHVQKLLEHSRVDTTAIYAGLFGDDVKEAVDRV